MKYNKTKYLPLLKGIIAINIFFFAASLILSGKNLYLSINPFTAISPSTDVLISLGATGTIPINQYSGQFAGESIVKSGWNYLWVFTLISANWLHGSLIHIIFNMIALFQIGELISVIYGMHRMFIIYTLSGIAGFYISYLAGIPVTIGASAAICGLLGAAFYFGRSQKATPAGIEVARMTSGWIFSLVIFGFAIPNINNWGHGGGFVAGILLGWLLEHNGKRKENSLYALLSFLLMTVTILGLILPFILLFLF